MEAERNTTIDYLRGLAVILMIFVHVAAYFSGIRYLYILWDYTHFIVPLFIFCSAYLFFKKDTLEHINFGYIWKRVKRLVIPYYIFLIVFFSYLFLFERDSLTTNAVLKLGLLSTDRDLDWLVILFLILVFLFPFIQFLEKKFKPGLFLYGILAVVSSVYLLFFKTDIQFRWIMWLPWSVYILYCLIFVRFENKKRMYVLSLVISGVTFLLSRETLNSLEKSLVFTNNKYPPNIYYLSYGIFWTTVSYLIFKLIDNPLLVKPFNFLSRHSYSLYFIHFVFVKALVKSFDYKSLTWGGMLIVVSVLTIVTQMGLNKLTSFRR